MSARINLRDVPVQGLRQRTGWQMVWVSRDSVDATSNYFTNDSFANGDVFADPPYRTYAQLGLAAVPKTIVVGTAGNVEQVWRGQFDQDIWKHALAYLGISGSPLLPSQSPSDRATAFN